MPTRRNGINSIRIDSATGWLLWKLQFVLVFNSLQIYIVQIGHIMMSSLYLFCFIFSLVTTPVGRLNRCLMRCVDYAIVSATKRNAFMEMHDYQAFEWNTLVANECQENAHYLYTIGLYDWWNVTYDFISDKKTNITKTRNKCETNKERKRQKTRSRVHSTFHVNGTGAQIRTHLNALLTNWSMGKSVFLLWSCCYRFGLPLLWVKSIFAVGLMLFEFY